MAADIDVGIHRRGSSTPSVPVPVPCGNGPQGRFANMTVPVGRGSPPGSAPAGILKLSRSADNLAALGAVSGTPPPAGSYTSRNSFMAVSGKQDAELLKSVQRKLVGDASLFFDILSEGNCDARDAKIKRVASDQRLKDMEMAHAASLNSSEGGLPSASQLAGNAGHLSASHLSAAAADADQDSEMRFEDDLREAALRDADASRLLRNLCGDMYIDAAQLDNFEPLGQGAFATVQKCRLRRLSSVQDRPDQRTSIGKRLAMSRAPSFRRASPADSGGQNSKGVKNAAGGQLVAVKQLKPAVLGDETELHGFIAETDVLRQLRHPAIVEFKGVGAMRNESAEAMRRSMFLVQELMAGGTLKALLVDAYYSTLDHRLFSRQDALRWALQIAEALAYLHHFSPLIVHRDLKLENILLTSPHPSKADAKLADFGLHKCIKDVASGVPMAQSTEQLQSLLKDMGFDALAAQQERRSTDVAAQQQGQVQAHRPAPADAAAGQPRQFPLVPSAAAQISPADAAADAAAAAQAAATAARAGHSPALVANIIVQQELLRRTAEAMSAAAAQNGQSQPDATIAGSPCASGPRHSGLESFESIPEERQAPGRAGLLLIRPELLQPAAAAAYATERQPLPPPGAPEQQCQPPPVQQQQQQQQQQQFRRWSEGGAPQPAAQWQEHLGGWHQRRPEPTPQLATPFAAPGLPRLSREDSAQLNDLSLEADDIVEEALARRSNSGPLSRPMLEGLALPPAPPCLATKSMGILGRDAVTGPGAQLPPLPRGSGVAQRLRGIRAVSRELDGGKSGSAPAQQAALNAEVAAKLRVSRGREGDGLASDPAAGAGSTARASNPSAHGSVKALLALVAGRRSTRRSSVDSGCSDGNDSPMFAAHSGASSTRRAHLMQQLRKVSLAKVSCGMASEGSAYDGSVHLASANMAYRMTGQTGSLCYMAPEVLRGTFYNEKVDVFSLGVVMWELFSYTPTIAIVSGEDMVDRVFQYAERVAGGFRQPLPEDWPPEIRSLIADCWASNPLSRPSAAKVAKRLRAMQDSGVAKRWDENDARAVKAARAAGRGGGCCSCFAGGGVKP